MRLVSTYQPHKIIHEVGLGGIRVKSIGITHSSRVAEHFDSSCYNTAAGIL